MQTDCREVHRQPSTKLYASLDGIDQLWDIGVARIEAGVGVDNADDWSRESIFTIPKGFDKDFTEEEGEVSVAV